MDVYVDIDNVICEGRGQTEGPEDYSYESAVPIEENIKKINQIYEDGHTVVYWTARGTKTGKNWRPLTERQLQRWGCKYDELKMGKPAFDVFVDDKAFNAERFDEFINYTRQ
jgi:hypothetical protein